MHDSPLVSIVFVSALLFAGSFSARGEVVLGWEHPFCLDEIILKYSSVADACASSLIKAYSLESESFEYCHSCDDVRLLPTPVVVVVPVLVCPSEFHLHGDECHANHICERDQIGGGTEDCKTCPDGEAPNWKGKACNKCEHGESDPPGQCLPDPACGRGMTDLAAQIALSSKPRQPWEEGAMFVCKNKQISAYEWATSLGSKNVCSVSIVFPADQQPSCWSAGDHMKDRGCNLTVVHTHPFFVAERDHELKCGTESVSMDKVRVERLNLSNMNFSDQDLDMAKEYKVEAHLGVSDRSVIKVFRRTYRIETLD